MIVPDAYQQKPNFALIKEINQSVNVQYISLKYKNDFFWQVLTINIRIL